MAHQLTGSTDRHSKVCLRRLNSKATLVSNDRHSRLCLRHRARRTRWHLQNIIRSFRVPSNGQDYFSRRLPTEIRLSIYKYILQFDLPLKLTRQPRRKASQRAAGVLLTNRLIYTEALPVFYELNTIVVNRSEFCQYPVISRPRPSCKPEVVQQLYFHDLHPSVRCAATISHGWPVTRRPCEHCRPSILGLLDAVRTLPRLKQVFIDYHRHAASVRALAEGLKDSRDVSSELRLTCTGVGKYDLIGERLEGVDIELRDVPLYEIWSRVLLLPSPVEFVSYFRGICHLQKDVRALGNRYDSGEIRKIVAKLSALLALHDTGTVPSSIAGIWPADLPMDYRRVEHFDRSDFFHKFNEQLQSFLTIGHTSDGVPRRT